MTKQHHNSKQGNSISSVPEMHAAQLIRLEDLGLSMQQSKTVPSGTAILVQATQHILDTSRRDNGFWNRIGIVSSESTGARTGVVYVLADGELHLLVLTGAEAEVQDLLADAWKRGHMLILWVTRRGDRRLSLVQFDECLVGLLRGAGREFKSDILSSMFDVVNAAQYALSHDILRRVGVDPRTVRRQVVHYLATPSMLNGVDRLAATK